MVYIPLNQSKVNEKQEQNVTQKLVSRFDQKRQDEIKSSHPNLLESHVFVLEQDLDHPLRFSRRIFKGIKSGIPYCGTIINNTKMGYIKKNIETLFNDNKIDPEIAFVIATKAIEAIKTINQGDDPKTGITAEVKEALLQEIAKTWNPNDAPPVPDTVRSQPKSLLNDIVGGFNLRPTPTGQSSNDRTGGLADAIVERRKKMNGLGGASASASSSSSSSTVVLTPKQLVLQEYRKSMTETRCELLGLQDSDFEVKRAIDVFKEIEIEGTDIVPFIKAQAKTITPHSLNILMQCGNQEAMGLIDLAVDAFAGLFDPDGFLEVSKNMKYMFAIALISQLKITARDKNKHIITRKKAMLIDGVRLKYMPSIKHPLTESLLKNQNSLESRPYRKAMKNVFDEVLAHMNLPAQQFFRPKNATQIFEIAGLMDKVILATKYMTGNIDGQSHVKRMAAFADFTAELPKAGDIIYNLIDFFDAEIVFKNQLANPEIQLIFMIAVIDRMVSSDEPLSPENRLRLLYIANTHYAHDVDFEHPDLLDE